MVNQPIGNHGLGIFWCGEIKVKRGYPNLKVIGNIFHKNCGVNLIQ